MAKMSTSFSVKRYFTTGLVALLPTAAAVWVIVWLLRTLQTLVLGPFFRAKWIGTLFTALPEGLLPWVQGAIGVVIVVFAVSGFGWLATNVAGRWFFGVVEGFMKKVPLASTVYSFVQGLIENLRIMRAGYFQKVVLIEFPRNGVWSLGFISRQLVGSIQDAVPGTKTAVFVPTSPNPTSGFIVVLNAQDVLPLDISPEDGLKFIMSGGVLMPGASKGAGSDQV